MFTNILRGVQQLRISEDVDDLDLASYIHGAPGLMLIIDSGVVVGSTIPNSGCIYSSGTVPPSFILRIVNSGDIIASNGHGGSGGAGGAGGLPGGSGGIGIKLNCNILVNTLNGTITAGGGGGGGGASSLLTGGSGGGGYPGGVGGAGEDTGVTARYGAALGGTGGYDGGNCQGAALAGTAGQNGTASGGAGGVKGYSIDASGNNVTIVSGASNIIGDII